MTAEVKGTGVEQGQDALSEMKAEMKRIVQVLQDNLGVFVNPIWYVRKDDELGDVPTILFAGDGEANDEGEGRRAFDLAREHGFPVSAIYRRRRFDSAEYDFDECVDWVIEFFYPDYPTFC